MNQMLDVGRRVPPDAFWCPVMAVTLDEYEQLWHQTHMLERWGREDYAERGYETLWDFDRGCWVSPIK